VIVSSGSTQIGLTNIPVQFTVNNIMNENNLQMKDGEKFYN
jgi:hypothetical protein